MPLADGLILWQMTPSKKCRCKHFCKSAPTPINKEIKAFVIRQLELIADEGQLDALTQFIEDERLSAPAIQVLAAIQSERQMMLCSVHWLKQPMNK